LQDPTDNQRQVKEITSILYPV